MRRRSVVEEEEAKEKSRQRRSEFEAERKRNESEKLEVLRMHGMSPVAYHHALRDLLSLPPPTSVADAEPQLRLSSHDRALSRASSAADALAGQQMDSFTPPLGPTRWARSRNRKLSPFSGLFRQLHGAPPAALLNK